MRKLVSCVRAVTLVGLLALLFSVLPSAGVVGAAMEVTVATDVLNVRARPTTASAVVDTLTRGDTVSVVATVDGEEVLGNNVSWFQTRSGGFIYSAFTRAGNGSRSRSSPSSSRWIEVDRSAQIARAFANGRVVRTAPVSTGVQAFPTPVGEFRILRRVANETMDSSTIGIPLGTPGSYFLEGVLFTQYITDDGVALHYNYWSPRDAFGNYPTSHGCIGLLLEDARFFWDFATIGTPVIIRS
ncbi:MAG: L,D-transpeptidase family protein [Chloroflexi bacterium]|nr:L,D-transpeptidase family protein [Chloroflexota bacterium]